MWPFRRFKGMICPNMGLSFEDSRRVADRKSEAMVGYLRARRSVHDPMTPEWARKIDLEALQASRRAHLRKSRTKRLVAMMRPLS
jgi:hypothetical protein